MAEHAAHSAARRRELEALIRDIGSQPYPSWGIGARLTPPLTGCVAMVSLRVATRVATTLAEHTLSEYRTLEAFVEDAPGVATEIRRRVGPMQEQAVSELAALRQVHSGAD